LFDRYASELVALGPDVLLAQSSPSVVALRQKTSTLPIVFTMVSDPVGQGFVQSLAHPAATSRVQRFQRADGRQMAGDVDAGHPP